MTQVIYWGIQSTTNLFEDHTYTVFPDLYILQPEKEIFHLG